MPSRREHRISGRAESVAPAVTPDAPVYLQSKLASAIAVANAEAVEDLDDAAKWSKRYRREIWMFVIIFILAGLVAGIISVCVIYIPQPSPVAIPTQFVATGVTSTGCVLTWNGQPGDGYILKYSHDNGVSYQQIGPQVIGIPTFTVTGLTAQTTYLFTVFALNGGSTSENSAVLSVTTLASPV